jgi:transcriptional regulator with XRE-family HTH domain
VDKPDEGIPGLAEKLNHLFATIPRPDGEALWTNERAAAALTEAGTDISGAYLSLLRLGHRTNPSAKHLAAIARLFGVPIEYFFNPELHAHTDLELRLLGVIQRAGLEGLGRSVGLSPAGIALLVDFADQLRRYEATVTTTAATRVTNSDQ